METKPIRYPSIRVKLSGTDGNAYAILAKVRNALRKGGVDSEMVRAFTEEATEGDYGHLLMVCSEWVDIR